jgi:hypothetical protein
MRIVRILLLPVMGLVCAGALAQGPAQVKVGDSYVALAGPWKFAPGDSPVVQGKLAWAQPGFDDAGWAGMDLHPDAGAVDPGYGSAGYVPGWSAKGYRELAGYAWYRLRIHVAQEGEPLAIKMPDHVDDAYQVYANGVLVGSFGEFGAGWVKAYRARPMVYSLPAPDAHGDIELALRFYMEPFVAAAGTTPDGGGMHEMPLVGQPAVLEYLRSQEVRGRLLSQIPSIFVLLLMLIAAAGAVWIWILDGRRPTYFWLMLALLCEMAVGTLTLAALFSTALSQEVWVFLVNAIHCLQLVFWVFFWRRWFQLDKSKVTEVVVCSLFLAALLVQIGVYFFSQHLGLHVVLRELQFRTLLKVLLGSMLFVALFGGARKDRTAAVLALPAILLLSVSLFSQELLTWFRVRTAFFPFGMGIGIVDVASVAMVLVVGALVARRFIESQVSQRMVRQSIEQELDKARELQQHVLIPEPVRSALFAVDTAYYPARSVGGDFFQVIPHKDGSLLIVVGDVSGKGMAAAMLVAVLVGAICTRADETFDPAAILETLNERLLGRAGGHFATCVVAHLRAGGEMRIGNAGHIPPYLNGVAMEIEGSLPLGILARPRYEVVTLQTEPGDYLTFMTDGVLEARGVGGELLGFERMGKMSGQSAEAIAAAAIKYGQDDDITVVGVSVREAV